VQDIFLKFFVNGFFVYFSYNTKDYFTKLSNDSNTSNIVTSASANRKTFRMKHPQQNLNRNDNIEYQDSVITNYTTKEQADQAETLSFELLHIQSEKKDDTWIYFNQK